MSTRFRIGVLQAALAAMVLVAMPIGHAHAQSGSDPASGATTGKGDFVGEPFPRALLSPLPYATPDGGVSIAPGGGQGPETLVTIEAHLTEGSGPLVQEIDWRVFNTHPDGEGNYTLLATASGGIANIPLPVGEYLVHASFGRAGATRRLNVGSRPFTETLVLDAGGLRLYSVVGDDREPRAGKVFFEISQDSEEGEKIVVARDIPPGEVVGLNTGVYHVISRYGAVNAIVRADIEVTAGKLTDVTMRHTGAEVTLKLVELEGGEALANTKWTVLTNAGDTVHESVGAFPRIILAEGAYTAVAQHNQSIYTRDFKTAAGIDTDVEVRLSDIITNPSRVEDP